MDENIVKNSPLVDPQFRKVLNQNVIKILITKVAGTAAATAANYGSFFTADRGYYFIGAIERHRTAGTNGSPVGLNIEKIGSGVAEGSGVELLDTNFDLKGTADTPQYGVVTTVNTDRIISRGDSLSLKDSGTLTDVADVSVTVYLNEI